MSKSAKRNNVFCMKKALNETISNNLYEQNWNKKGALNETALNETALNGVWVYLDSWLFSHGMAKDPFSNSFSW